MVALFQVLRPGGIADASSKRTFSFAHSSIRPALGFTLFRPHPRSARLRRNAGGAFQEFHSVLEKKSSLPLQGVSALSAETLEKLSLQRESETAEANRRELLKDTDKWVVFSDLHVCQASLKTCVEVLRQVHKAALERNAGVLFLGDFWHVRGDIRTDHLHEMVAEFRQWKVPVVMIPGNHDQVNEDGSVHGLIALGAAFHHGRCQALIFDRPTLFLDALWLPHCKDNTSLTRLINAVGAGGRESGCKSVFCHVEVNGAETNDNCRVTGGILVEDLPENLKIFSGHFHRPQTVVSRNSDAAVTYVGSPYQTSLCEANQPKRLLLLSKSAGWEVEEEIPIDVGKRFFRARCLAELPSVEEVRPGDEVVLTLEREYEALLRADETDIKNALQQAGAMVASEDQQAEIAKHARAFRNRGVLFEFRGVQGGTRGRDSPASLVRWRRRQLQLQKEREGSVEGDAQQQKTLEGSSDEAPTKSYSESEPSLLDIEEPPLPPVPVEGTHVPVAFEKPDMKVNGVPRQAEEAPTQPVPDSPPPEVEEEKKQNSAPAPPPREVDESSPASTVAAFVRELREVHQRDVDVRVVSAVTELAEEYLDGAEWARQFMRTRRVKADAPKLDIRFDSVEVENFGPFCDTARLQLSDRGYMAIEGVNVGDEAADSNGAGKTSLLMSALWALTGGLDGRLATDGKVTDVVSDAALLHAKGKMGTSPVARVTVQGQLNGRDFEVTRSRGWGGRGGVGAGLRFILGGEDLTQQTPSGTQNLLSEYFGANLPLLLVRTVFHGQHAVDDLLSATDQRIKEHLSLLVPSSMWQACALEASNRRRHLNLKHRDALAQIELRQRDVALLTDQWHAAEARAQALREEVERRRAAAAELQSVALQYASGDPEEAQESVDLMDEGGRAITVSGLSSSVPPGSGPSRSPLVSVKLQQQQKQAARLQPWQRQSLLEVRQLLEQGLEEGTGQEGVERGNVAVAGGGVGGGRKAFSRKKGGAKEAMHPAVLSAQVEMAKEDVERARKRAETAVGDRIRSENSLEFLRKAKELHGRAREGRKDNGGSATASGSSPHDLRCPTCRTPADSTALFADTEDGKEDEGPRVGVWEERLSAEVAAAGARRVAAEMHLEGHASRLAELERRSGSLVDAAAAKVEDGKREMVGASPFVRSLLERAMKILNKLLSAESEREREEGKGNADEKPAGGPSEGPVSSPQGEAEKKAETPSEEEKERERERARRAAEEAEKQAQVRKAAEEELVLISRVEMEAESVARIAEERRLQAERAEKDLHALTEEAAQSEKEREVLGAAADFAGSRGLQAFLLSSAVQQLESRVRHYLEKLSGGRLDMMISLKGGETIQRTVGVLSVDGSEFRERSLAQLSGGQWRRVSLALALGFASLAQQRGRLSSNLLVLDEVFTHLDRSGRRQVALLLRELAGRPAGQRNGVSDVWQEQLEAGGHGGPISRSVGDFSTVAVILPDGMMEELTGQQMVGAKTQGNLQEAEKPAAPRKRGRKSKALATASHTAHVALQQEGQLRDTALDGQPPLFDVRIVVTRDSDGASVVTEVDNRKQEKRLH
uniref:Calcineurin-like phosphoesterase domain-containing protein n=1 Tax=Chromera velia CCMP2878 TaxID=1169474 RepID=A0A0G4I8L5_9ALVE|eukprot:Cvel_1986.t1-p1 / transcript=Cvel_1986.t1 / gene=Cvel_1986 / organism=Chromera_velia_CCMP2878 / gene_product=hypothetical protein / transcript_product=hypothetical protein / location=Cvel_scaffold75:111112-120163(+) / protein_length=1565 / sequence_SO=supercontig / SO=protein_coding / is_pseudo=false